jgi:AcrR family transcriptional regulator
MKRKIIEEITSAQKILEAARKEFARHGLDGARVDRIAHKAKVNKAMIYYHFHSKDNLYQAVIDDHLSQIGSFIEHTISEEPNIEKLLLQLAYFYNEILTKREDFVPIFLRELATGGERMRMAFKKMITEKGFHTKLKQLMDRGKESGQFREMDSLQAIISFLGMNMYYPLTASVINTVWEIKDEKIFREKRPTEVVNLFLYGLIKR